MILALLETAADSNRLLFWTLLVQCISFGYMLKCRYDNDYIFHADPPPDFRFGYSVDALNTWFDQLGYDGCRSVYLKFAIVDLFPFMQTYVVLLAAPMIWVARTSGKSTKLALIFVQVMMFDVVKTCIPAYGCHIYPERLPPPVILVASTANRLKWTSAAIGFAMIVALYFETRRAETKARQGDHDKSL